MPADEGAVVLVTETAPNPRHVEYADKLLKALEGMSPEKAEEVLTMRIIVRHGVARKVKWIHEEEECYS